MEQSPQILGRGQCARCNSLAADLEAMRTQHAIDRKCWEQRLEQADVARRGYEQTIEHLRQDKAVLQLNADMRLDRRGGFNTAGMGE